MNQFCLAHDTEFSGPNRDVPVIAEFVEYPSLEAALAAWPGYHNATDAEYLAYVTYWNDVHAAKT